MTTPVESRSETVRTLAAVVLASIVAYPYLRHWPWFVADVVDRANRAITTAISFLASIPADVWLLSAQLLCLAVALWIVRYPLSAAVLRAVRLRRQT